MAAPVVGMAASSGGGGYFSFGDAEFDGPMGGAPLNAPIVGVASALEAGT